MFFQLSRSGCGFFSCAKGFPHFLCVFNLDFLLASSRMPSVNMKISIAFHQRVSSFFQEFQGSFFQNSKSYILVGELRTGSAQGTYFFQLHRAIYSHSKSHFLTLYSKLLMNYIPIQEWGLKHFWRVPRAFNPIIAMRRDFAIYGTTFSIAMLQKMKSWSKTEWICEEGTGNSNWSITLYSLSHHGDDDGHLKSLHK